MINSIISRLPRYFSEGTIVMLSILLSFYLEDIRLTNEKSNYKNELVVIGVPTNNFKQEPKNNAEIKKFCEANFGITFPMSEKVDVIGANAHDFFKWAKKNHGIPAIPKWNFHKIIIGKDGKVADTFASFTKPTSKKFINAISKEIKS